MITDEKELQKIADFTRQAKERGFSAQQVDGFLKSKGSSLAEAAGIIQYGAKNVARSRLAGQAEKERQDKERPWYQKAVNGIADFFGENKLGRAMLSTLQGINKGNPLVQIASLAPGMDWVNDDAITPETAIERALDIGAQFATPAGITAKAMNAVVKAPKIANALAKTKLGRGVAGFLTPASMPLEYAGAFGAGAATGAVDPDSLVGKIVTAMAGGIGGAGVLGAINRFGPGAARNFIGRSALRNELDNAASGRVVSDVDFGRLDKDTVNTINNMPELSENVVMNGNSVIIPARTVQKLYDKRVIGNKIKPDDLVDATQHIFYGKGSSVTPSGNRNSVIFANKDTPSGYGIVLPNKDNMGTNTIETVIRARPERIETVLNQANSRLDGRNGPSSPVIANGARALRISGLQPTDNTIISTNSELVKNMVDALSDNVKTRRMKEGVMSGATDVQQRAAKLSDNLVRRKEGAQNPILDDAMLTPQMRQAQIDYDAYMTKYGNLDLDLSHFYRENPAAKGLIDEARAIDPQSFKNIKRGSLKEAEILKQLLKTSSGRVGETAGKIRAYNTARENLKNLVETKAPGYRDLNRRYADAETTQELFENLITRNARQVASATTSPFWSGITSPLSAAGVVAGYIDPIALLGTAGMLGGKSIMRQFRRSNARNVANGGTGIIKSISDALNTPVTSMVGRNAVIQGVYDNE